ncbi:MULTISPECIES: hypothetical protein [unclassified Pseudofrankia]|uniref:hypothetical protein n=1 Tax=unclassified Pseudofrankia TaxID=2994372 RepID=UPI0008D9F87C|nr:MULTISPECIES: hypothetical protein [unclassified Pseudofrankia]MDT3443508.1 hypothetical protein [Pseudofrankia sp. BMG5.37]OHV42752.1 hypothetical protein BCD48_30165 [Pseudofrankia sp. BMG5.36]
MTTVFTDSPMPDDRRRSHIYQGDIFVTSPNAATRALTDFARELVEEAFAPLDPQQAQHEIPVEKFVEIFGPVKPKFIHHPKTKSLLRDIVDQQSADLDETYIDVPRLRGATSDGYLTAGVGYAFPLHRDVWWSAPLAQINWWLPIFDFESESSMAFHPHYWDTGISNGSEEFNYYVYNATGRAQAAQHVGKDTRKQPGPREPVRPEPQIRVVCPAGGMIGFSAAQMHSTVPNTSGRTRFSIDFRTVNAADLRAGRSAPNVDTYCEGTSLRDFRRGSDGSPMPAELVAQYDSGEIPEGAVLVYEPVTAASS